MVDLIIWYSIDMGILSNSSYFSIVTHPPLENNCIIQAGVGDTASECGVTCIYTGCLVYDIYAALS